MLKYVTMSVLCLSAVCFAQENEPAEVTTNSESSFETRDAEVTLETSVESNQAE